MPLGALLSLSAKNLSKLIYVVAVDSTIPFLVQHELRRRRPPFREDAIPAKKNPVVPVVLYFDLPSGCFAP